MPKFDLPNERIVNHFIIFKLKSTFYFYLFSTLETGFLNMLKGDNFDINCSWNTDQCIVSIHLSLH